MGPRNFRNFKQSMGTRRGVGIGLLYRPARLHNLAELVPWNHFFGSLKFKNSGLIGWWNRFLGSLNVYKFGPWCYVWCTDLSWPREVDNARAGTSTQWPVGVRSCDLLFKSVLRIRDIFVRIRIRRSVPLTNGSRFWSGSDSGFWSGSGSGFGSVSDSGSAGSYYFRQWPSSRQLKFCKLLLEAIFYNFSKIKSHK